MAGRILPAGRSLESLGINWKSRNCGSIPASDKNDFSFLLTSQMGCEGPPTLLFSGYYGTLCRGKAAGS